ncbi:hypothetical protein BCF74_11092 [Knoellia remsis]|uniref:DUF779 domain-containing protein n=1 Tax=Knoellia remsis TaxID=407159 RepID=A0A2T0UN47_9MICO|nr:DUF779 domain-containing protein [Knoellia remsis]PRY59355.1 hypothetical protein BCF74_11092 [Knoellia remsis]
MEPFTGGGEAGVRVTPGDMTRVDLTAAAATLLAKLEGVHGPLMFHQSGGCCDGSSPMCFPVGEFMTSEADVMLGVLAPEGVTPIEFWMSTSQYEYWKHTHLTVDVVPGRGSGFSVEAPEGVRFLIRSRLMTQEELVAFGLL